MIAQPHVQAHGNTKRTYWLASGVHNGRVILAEGDTRKEAMIQWRLAAFIRSGQDCSKLREGAA